MRAGRRPAARHYSHLADRRKTLLAWPEDLWGGGKHAAQQTPKLATISSTA